MSCCVSNCTRANCLLLPVKCTDPYIVSQLLLIGVVDDPDTLYTVYVEEENTGNLRMIPAISDSNGELTISLDDVDTLNQYSPFALWVTLEGADMEAIEHVTIGEEQHNCFVLTFRNSGKIEPIQNQTITV